MTAAEDAYTQLDAVYDTLPEVDCRGLCQEGCGSIGMTPLEQQRIQDRHHIRLPLRAIFGGEPTPLGITTDHCPALTTAGQCSVYPDRPLICRLYGAVRTMPCPWGCAPKGGHLDTFDAVHAQMKVEALSNQGRPPQA